MSKNFTVKIPDQPYKNSFSLGKTVDCAYVGPNFLVVAIQQSDNKVGPVLDGANNVDDLKLENYFFENHYLMILNALEKPFEAAYITKLYKNPLIEAYKETLPTGEVYEYPYDENAIIENVYQSFEMYYDKSADRFSMPPVLLHPISRDRFLSGINSKIEMFESLKIEKNFTQDELQLIDNALNWYKNLEKNYPNIDHWKIPVPIFQLPDY